jgi:hypothetical protein
VKSVCTDAKRFQRRSLEHIDYTLSCLRRYGQMRRLIFVYEAEHELLYTSSWTILDGFFFLRKCAFLHPNLGESRKSPENDIVDKN